MNRTLTFGFGLVVLTMLVLAITATGRASVPPALSLSCARGFELTVRAEPTQGVPGSTGVALFIKVPPGQSSFELTRLHSGEKRKLSNARCVAWERDVLPLLRRAARADTQPSASRVCVNRGVLEYRTAGGSGTAQLCLIASAKDQMTTDFREFYERTDRFMLE